MGLLAVINKKSDTTKEAVKRNDSGDATSLESDPSVEEIGTLPAKKSKAAPIIVERNIKEENKPKTDPSVLSKLEAVHRKKKAKPKTDSSGHSKIKGIALLAAETSTDPALNPNALYRTTSGKAKSLSLSRRTEVRFFKASAQKASEGSVMTAKSKRVFPLGLRQLSHRKSEKSGSTDKRVTFEEREDDLFFGDSQDAESGQGTEKSVTRQIIERWTTSVTEKLAAPFVAMKGVGRNAKEAYVNPFAGAVLDEAPNTCYFFQCLTEDVARLPATIEEAAHNQVEEQESSVVNKACASDEAGDSPMAVVDGERASEAEEDTPLQEHNVIAVDNEMAETEKPLQKDSSSNSTGHETTGLVLNKEETDNTNEQTIGHEMVELGIEKMESETSLELPLDDDDDDVSTVYEKFELVIKPGEFEFPTEQHSDDSIIDGETPERVVATDQEIETPLDEYPVTPTCQRQKSSTKKSKMKHPSTKTRSQRVQGRGRLHLVGMR